jgi:hypothetical protein
MASVVILGDTSGSVTITAPAVAGTPTLTLPTTTGTILTTASTAVVTQAMLSTNVVGNGPAFSAYLSANQNITATTLTKLAIDTKIYDTDTCYNTSTYTFTPTVAGYYQVTATTTPDSSATNPTNGYIQLQKNGSNFLSSWYSGNANGPSVASINALVYFNGTTDSISAWLYLSGGSGTLKASSSTLSTFFQAFMVRTT